MGQNIIMTKAVITIILFPLLQLGKSCIGTLDSHGIKTGRTKENHSCAPLPIPQFAFSSGTVFEQNEPNFYLIFQRIVKYK